jgi:hypothetical protein
MPEKGPRPPARSAVVKKIEDAQAEALRLIQEAKLSDARASLAMRRIRQLAVSVFLELDECYRTFQALSQEPGRDSVHQQWENERISSIMMQTERAMGEVVSASLRQIAAEAFPPKPKEVVREVIVTPPSREYPAWLKGIGTLCKGLLQYAGFALLLGILFGNPFIAIFVPRASYVLLHDQPGGFIVWGIIPSLIALVVWVILLIL